MPQLEKALITIAIFIIATALAAILPNLTYKTPTPSIACHSPQAIRYIWYNEYREALETFRSEHQGSPLYALSHIRDPPGETRFIICLYKLRLDYLCCGLTTRTNGHTIRLLR